ncbi:phosphatase domain-containing protein [Modestobacter lapidis]
MYDLDGTLGLMSPGGLLRRVRGLLSPTTRDRRSVLGMSGVLRELVAQQPDTPVLYLTSAPRWSIGLIRERMRNDVYPPGTLLTAERGLLTGWRPGGIRRGKERTIDRALRRESQLRWVLIGDDADDDPGLFRELAAASPGRVAAIALREVVGDHRRNSSAAAGSPLGECASDVPVVWAPNGEELLPLLRSSLGLSPPRGDAPGGAAPHWLLGGAERGNEATRLRAWTEGNAAHALLHGCSYFPALADALARTGPGDLITILGWRGDTDERLSPGWTVGEALVGAAGRGALVRGLLWRSYSSALGFSAAENRELALHVTAGGGQVLLDQRTRPLGSHHQKLVVVRYRQRPADDVAFVGGIDIAHSRRDDDRHAGDPQSRPLHAAYGPRPAWHDVQVGLRGPAVRDAEEVFRERWEDPAALSRLPWRVLADRVRRLQRTAEPLPPAGPDPPRAGSCAVQLLRTYPHRWPSYPFAPRGERSVARAYAKALSRAQRLVYVEDQYLWSMDVARVFATALHRAPGLQLIAVVPRHPDQESPLYLRSASLGHAGALGMVFEAGGDRVQILDVETSAGRPVYVHSKVCIVDDVWAAVGSANFNSRSWTHDSELTAAILDDERDQRAPADPGGLGDGARRFARRLRLDLMREHLQTEDDSELLDPDRAAAAIRGSVAALDAWHAHGCRGPRPAGRLRRHAGDEPVGDSPDRRRLVVNTAYRTVLDPDGRPLGLKLRRGF